MGFAEEELAAWPRSLTPRSLTPRSLAAAVTRRPAIVVAHRRAAGEFAAMVQEWEAGRETGRPPDAVLYLPAGDDISPRLASYFCAVVAAEDWPGLETALADAATLPLLEESDEVPLYELAQGPEEVDDATLLAVAEPLLSEAARAACTEDARFRARFLAALRQRIALWRRMMPPPLARRYAYAQARPGTQRDAWVEAYLQGNPAAAAATRLRQRQAEATAHPAWSTWCVAALPDRRALARQLAQVSATGSQWGEQLAAALLALVNGGLQTAPVGVRGARAAVDAGATGTVALGESLLDLIDLETLDLYTADDKLALGLEWREAEETLTLYLIGEEPATRPALRVRLEWSGGEADYLQDAQGAVAIPAADLARALAGAGRLSLQLATKARQS